MADYSFTDFELEDQVLGQIAENATRGLDAQLSVQFFRHAELNAAASREANRKIFDDHVYIRIMMPANRLNEVVRRATEADKLRFQRLYTAFIQNGEQLVTGTPLDQLSNMTAGQVLELKALKIDTVEQLANLPDTTAQLLGTGGLELKRRAGVYLAKSTDATKLYDEMAAMKAELARLTAAAAQVPNKAEDTVKVTTQAQPAKG